MNDTLKITDFEDMGFVIYGGSEGKYKNKVCSKFTFNNGETTYSFFDYDKWKTVSDPGRDRQEKDFEHLRACGVSDEEIQAFVKRHFEEGK